MAAESKNQVMTGVASNDGATGRGPGRGSVGRRTLLIPSLRCGRLANRLVLFANFIALAEELGLRVSNVTFHSYAHLFVTTRRDLYCRYPGGRRSGFDLVPGLPALIRRSRLLYHAVRGASRLNERLPLLGRKVVTLREKPGQEIISLEEPELQARIQAARIVFAYGWRFRAPRCVTRHAAKIRAYFRPWEPYEQASRLPVAWLRERAEVVVGVHVRQGDYRTWRGGQCFFPPSRYAVWMRDLARQVPGRKVAFFVCSDEPRTEQEFPGLMVRLGAGPPVVDLCALAECDYILGPLSTFSQWASFYGNKPLFHFRDAKAEVKLNGFAVSDLAEIP